MFLMKECGSFGLIIEIKPAVRTFVFLCFPLADRPPWPFLGASLAAAKKAGELCRQSNQKPSVTLDHAPSSIRTPSGWDAGLIQTWMRRWRRLPALTAETGCTDVTHRLVSTSGLKDSTCGSFRSSASPAQVSY